MSAKKYEKLFIKITNLHMNIANGYLHILINVCFNSHSLSLYLEYFSKINLTNKKILYFNIVFFFLFFF